MEEGCSRSLRGFGKEEGRREEISGHVRKEEQCLLFVPS